MSPPDSPLYTRPEGIAIAWIPRFSATLSILGSAMIVMMILRGGKAKLERMHNRLFLPMSTIDILNSIALGASTAPFPRELKDVFYGAVGNKATCVVQGFFTAFGSAVPLYNASLCVYFLAVIKYNIPDDTLIKYERYMHGFAILPPLFGSIFAASFNLYHPRSKGVCMFADGCEFGDPDTCIPRPHALTTFLKVYSLTVGAIVVLTIVYCMGSIYYFVRTQAIAMRKYQSFQRGNSINGGIGRNGREKTSTHRETMIQAVLYVIAFFSSFIWVIVLAFMKSDKAAPFAIMVLKSIFNPMQGFWNFIIFCRPKYVDMRQKKKDYSFFQIMKIIVFPTAENASQHVEYKNQRRNSRLMKMIKRSSMVPELPAISDSNEEKKAEADYADDPEEEKEEIRGYSHDLEEEKEEMKSYADNNEAVRPTADNNEDVRPTGSDIT